MVVVPPATPPSTVASPPSSPTSPADTSTQGFEHDLEKGRYNEKRPESHDDDCHEKGATSRQLLLLLINKFSRQRCPSRQYAKPRSELGLESSFVETIAEVPLAKRRRPGKARSA